MFNSPDEVAAYIRDNDVEYVDVRFCDLPGVCPKAISVSTVTAANAARDQLPGRSGAVNRPATRADPRASTQNAPMRTPKLARDPGPSAGNPREAPRTGC